MYGLEKEAGLNRVPSANPENVGVGGEGALHSSYSCRSVSVDGVKWKGVDIFGDVRAYFVAYMG